MTRIVIIIACLACVGCGASIEYGRLTPDLKSVVDACSAIGGIPDGPNIRPNGSYKISCVIKRKD